MTLVETRGDQLFPVLDAAQIETAKRFASGPARDFAPGEHVYDVGERHTPTWLVLEGAIEVVHSRRPQSRGGDHHPEGRTIQRRAQPALRARDPGRRTRGSRGLHRPAVRRAACPRAGGRLCGGRRGCHARLHPAPRGVDRGGRGGLGADRPAWRAGSGATAGLSCPQRLSLHRAGRCGRRGRPRHYRALRRAAGGAAADGLPRRHVF